MATAIGQRERNNLERRATLLVAARRLFNEQGFEATSVEQIAAATQLAPRTVYNFFPAKVDLLAALLSDEVQNLMGSRPVGDRLPDSPRDGVWELVQAQVDTMACLAKSEQKLVVARSILAVGDSEAGRYSAEIDKTMRTSIRQLLVHYQDHGALHQDVDPDVATGLIFSMLNGLYIEWLQSDTTFDSVMTGVPAYLDLLLRGPVDPPTAEVLD